MASLDHQSLLLTDLSRVDEERASPGGRPSQPCSEKTRVYNVSGFMYCMDRIRFLVIRTIAYPNGVRSQLIRINDVLLQRQTLALKEGEGSDSGRDHDSQHEIKLLPAASQAANNSMLESAKSIAECSNECGVSVDGTWQKRGYSSLNGCVSTISVDSGKILDTLKCSVNIAECVRKPKKHRDSPKNA
ncbi:hypothetical protein TNCV_1927061 [Trichonephila clavipes]|nr:hypothetical protein TNCV_1927061 [Trichonephila clavipes]